jgi:catechol 2,3-dioxygenase-like lactoylglutathione lyase family enzyme
MSLSDCVIGPSVAVTDLEAARSFYEEKVGLRIKEAWGEEMTQYECGGDSALVLYHSPDHAGKSSHTQAGWAVPDLEAEIADLKSRGVKFESYDGENGPPTDENNIFNHQGMKVAWFRDPDGNTFALNQS